MAQNALGGAGLGLPYPQSLLPPSVSGAAYQGGGNGVALAGGGALVLPAGTFEVTLGKYLMLQYLDPVTTGWSPYKTAGQNPKMVRSDGQNYRVFNPTGCPIAAVITNAGTNYVQASTTCTASAGGSLWQPIVGGAVSTVTSVSGGSLTKGAGYGIAPLVYFPAPPAPGIQATGYTTITAGTVNGITITNQGAGYLTAPTPQIVTHPMDPNAGSVTPCVGKVTLTGAGTVTGLICINNGAPVATAPTLTIAGVGASAAATAVLCQTVTSGTVAGAGVGYSSSSYLTTIGGLPTATPILTNPQTDIGILDPRQATIGLAIGSGTVTSLGTIFDGGVFAYAPTAIVVANAVTTTAATITLGMGSAVDYFYIQPC